MFRARAAFISTKSRWIEATIQHIKLRDSIVTYITDTMHSMFSIVAISFDEFKRHFTSVEDTASVLVWVDAQLQQLFNVFAKTVLPSGNLQLIARCCSEALKYCELLEAKGIICAQHLQKELQVATKPRKSVAPIRSSFPLLIMGALAGIICWSLSRTTASP